MESILKLSDYTINLNMNQCCEIVNLTWKQININTFQNVFNKSVVFENLCKQDNETSELMIIENQNNILFDEDFFFENDISIDQIIENRYVLNGYVAESEQDVFKRDYLSTLLQLHEKSKVLNDDDVVKTIKELMIKYYNEVQNHDIVGFDDILNINLNE